VLIFRYLAIRITEIKRFGASTWKSVRKSPIQRVNDEVLKLGITALVLPWLSWYICIVSWTVKGTINIQ